MISVNLISDSSYQQPIDPNSTQICFARSLTLIFLCAVFGLAVHLTMLQRAKRTLQGSIQSLTTQSTRIESTYASRKAKDSEIELLRELCPPSAILALISQSAVDGIGLSDLEVNYSWPSTLVRKTRLSKAASEGTRGLTIQLSGTVKSNEQILILASHLDHAGFRSVLTGNGFPNSTRNISPEISDRFTITAESFDAYKSKGE